jgi:hypothetical protein
MAKRVAAESSVASTPPPMPSNIRRASTGSCRRKILWTLISREVYQMRYDVFRLSSVLAAAVLASGINPPCVANAGAIGPSSEILGSEITVFHWAADRCDAEDIPDVSLRVLNDGNREAEILSSNSNNRFRRLDLSTMHVRPACASALKSGRQADPNLYNDFSWLAALASDGKAVHALIHHEYHANDHAGKCRYRVYEQCWYNTITYARSDDGGQTFHQSVPPKVIAAPPFPQEEGQGKRRGFFNPSNIIFYQGYWWTFIYTSGWNGQHFGSCLFRSPDVSEPGSWRAYNGTGFTADFPDPYVSHAKNDVPTCLPIFDQTVGSISRTSDGRFVAAFIKREEAKGPGQKSRFFVDLAWSDDLIHWSAPEQLTTITDVATSDCSANARYAFPALVSIEDGVIRQGELRGRIFLSLVRFNIQNCKLSLNRDLVFRELTGGLVEPNFTKSK